jgi:hypothetical protein
MADAVLLFRRKFRHMPSQFRQLYDRIVTEPVGAAHLMRDTALAGSHALEPATIWRCNYDSTLKSAGAQ